MIFAALAAVLAAPCAAQLKDDASAMSALNSATAKDRLAAIYYLGAQRTPAAYEALASHFAGEKDAYLRTQLVDSLDVNASTWAFSCALAAAGDANRYVRQAAAMVLSRKAGDPAADKQLGALAADPSDSVRLALVNSLSVNPSTSSVAVLGSVLGDHKAALRTRRAAANVLSKMKTPASDDMVLRYLSDADSQIKAAAMSRRPTGKKRQ
jgi:HEAT repeat protein